MSGTSGPEQLARWSTAVAIWWPDRQKSTSSDPRPVFTPVHSREPLFNKLASHLVTSTYPNVNRELKNPESVEGKNQRDLKDHPNQPICFRMRNPDVQFYASSIIVLPFRIQLQRIWQKMFTSFFNACCVAGHRSGKWKWNYSGFDFQKILGNRCIHHDCITK